ncbi:MAG: MFS transporter [Chloroflexota bacterium]
MTQPNTSTSGAELVSTSIQSRLTATLFTAHGLLIAANVASFTLMPIVATQMVSESVAGVPSTLSMVGRALAGYPIGWIMERLGRRLGLSLGYLIAVLGGVVSVLSIGLGSFIGFCFGMGLLGAGRAASEQARFVAAEVSFAEQRAKVIGFVVAAGIIGGVGGPFLVAPSTSLMASLGFEPLIGAYATSTILALLAMFLVFFLLFPEPKKLSRLIEQREAGIKLDSAPIENATHMKEQTAQEEQKAQNSEAQRTFWEILSIPAVQLAMAALVIGQFVMVWLMVIMAVHMSRHDHTTASIAWVIALHNAGMYAFSWSVGWIIERIGQVQTIVVGAFVLALSTIMAPLSVGFPVLATSMFLVGLGWSLSFVAGSALLSDTLAPSERSQIQGTSESLLSAAGGIGSLGTAFIYANYGGMPVVGVMGLVISIGLVLAVTRYMLTIARPAAAT